MGIIEMVAGITLYSSCALAMIGCFIGMGITEMRK